MALLKHYFLAPLFFLVAGILPVIYFAFFKDPYFMGADVTQWRGDWERLTQCLGSALESCRAVGISKFPLGYLLNAGILGLIAPVGGTLKTQMGLINFSVLLLPIIFAFTVKPYLIALRIAAIYAIVLLCSPLPAFYVTSGALEVQSGVLTGILIASNYSLFFEKYSRKQQAVLYVFLVISALLVPLYKDTNLPILFGTMSIFAGLSIFYDKRAAMVFSGLRAQQVLIIIILFFISLTFVFIYNYVKYDSVLPLAYLNEANLTKPPLKKSAEFLFFSLFSLNGGLFVFWTFPCYLGFLFARYLGLEILSHIVRFGTTLVGVSLLSLSLWWVPFGWDSWGNRLIVPSMLAAIIACLLTAKAGAQIWHEDQESMSKDKKGHLGQNKFSRHILKRAVLGMYFLLSMGYVFITYASDHDPLFYFSLHGGVKCKEMMHEFGEQFPKVGWSFWQTKPYYKCARERFMHIPYYIVTQPQ